MHLLEAPEVREEESVRSLMERNRWWLEYLTDEDLRIEYARQILVRREEREMDQDVVDYYDQQYEEYFQGHDFSLFFYWWGVCFEWFVFSVFSGSAVIAHICSQRLQSMRNFSTCIPQTDDSHFDSCHFLCIGFKNVFTVSMKETDDFI